MKIAVVTKGNKQFGSGHLIRCNRIIDVLKRINQELELFVSLPEEFLPVVENQILLNRISQFSMSELKDSLKDKHFDLVIFDALTPDLKIIDLLQYHCNRMIILDWQYNDSDISILRIPTSIINGITGDLWPKHEYTKQGLIQHYQGIKFAILNPEINSLDKLEPIDQSLSFLVFMGGTDPYNWTQKIINNYQTIFNPILNQPTKIQFILGNGSNAASTIDLFDNLVSNQCFDNVTIHQIPGDFLDRLGKSDSIITCGGITMFEAAALGVFSIAIPQVEVQIPACRQFAENGLATLVSDDLTFDTSKLAGAVKMFVDQTYKLSDLRDKLASSVDCKGIERLIEVILSSGAS